MATRPEANLSLNSSSSNRYDKRWIMLPLRMAKFSLQNRRELANGERPFPA
jgi:hypothetical protein